MDHGRSARVGQLPWHVSVGVRRNRGPILTAYEGHQGGGTIIARQWVLTAAHCLAPLSDLLTDGAYTAGRSDVRLCIARGPDLRAPLREVDVTFALVHPRFELRTLACDVALLRLAEDMDGAVAMAEGDLTAGECGVVAGWGVTHGSSRLMPSLAWARMHVAHDAAGDDHDGGDGFDRATMFIAGGDAAACPGFGSARIRKGDSGGGFVVTRAGMPQLAGIVSWSARGADGMDGCVLTRTAPLASWIAGAATI
jgi:hypothetical protein